MDTKSNEQTLENDIHTRLKHHCTDYILIIKKKCVFTMETFGGTILTKWSSLALLL